MLTLRSAIFIMVPGDKQSVSKPLAKKGDLNGGPLWTVPELVFERKRLILALHRLLITERTYRLDSALVRKK